MCKIPTYFELIIFIVEKQSCIYNSKVPEDYFKLTFSLSERSLNVNSRKLVVPQYGDSSNQSKQFGMELYRIDFKRLFILI